MKSSDDLSKRISRILQKRERTLQRKEYLQRREDQREDQIERIRAELKSTIPGEVVTAGDGEFYLVRKKLAELCPEAGELSDNYRTIFAPGFRDIIDVQNLSSDFKKILNTEATGLLFLDIETTGFSNTPLFLVGTMYFNGEEFIIDQLFARDYSEEANILHYFTEFAPRFRILITFNGKTFDVPFIRDRMIYHRKYLNWLHTHVDILQHSRQRWRGVFADCKLQTLEREICSRRREDDVPGELVPDVYREFVVSGDASFLKDVFRHNALDLVTLMQLTVTLISQ